MVCVELFPICSNARKEEERMKKRGWLALAMILILAAAMTVFPAMAGGEKAVYMSGDYQYILLADGTAEITNCASEAASLSVPDQLDRYTVTSIGRWAFAGCRFLTSITLPDRLTSIGEHAFDSCRFLTSITFPDGLTSIGDEAFAACKSLASITLPNGLTSIGEEAFKDCFSLTSVILPDSLTSIGDSAFFQCQSLASITFPNSLTSIGGLAFYGCWSLTSVTLPDCLTSIGENPFTGCDQLAQIQVSPDHPALAVIDGALFSKAEKKLICYPCALTQESYTVPNGVTSIEDGAFKGCRFLKSITLPDSPIHIEENPFTDCDELMRIHVSYNHPTLASINGVLFSKAEKELISYPCASVQESYTVPDGITSIGCDAFYNCRFLTNITLPDSLTGIGEGAFTFCANKLTFAVGRGSWAANWCHKNRKEYTYPDSLDWLHN